MPNTPRLLSNRQMKELHDAFNLFDQDKSGAISASELEKVLKALNFRPNDELLRKIMNEMDTDGSGSVEFDEFVRVMASVYQRDVTEDEMRRAFQCFDTDNSGFITVQELRDVLRRLNHNVSEDQLREVIRQIDTDQDGKISFEEFVRIVQDG